MSQYTLILHDAIDASEPGRDALKGELEDKLNIPKDALNQMFSSLPSVVQQDLSKDQADNFLLVFENLGANVELLPQEIDSLRKEDLSFSSSENLEESSDEEAIDYDALTVELENDLASFEEESVDNDSFSLELAPVEEVESSVNSNVEEPSSSNNEDEGSSEKSAITSDSLSFVEEPEVQAKIANVQKTKEVEKIAESKESVEDSQTDTVETLTDTIPTLTDTIPTPTDTMEIPTDPINPFRSPASKEVTHQSIDEEPEENTEINPEAKKTKSRSLFIPAMLAAILPTLALGGYLFYVQQKNSESKLVNKDTAKLILSKQQKFEQKKLDIANKQIDEEAKTKPIPIAEDKLKVYTSIGTVNGMSVKITLKKDEEIDKVVGFTAFLKQQPSSELTKSDIVNKRVREPWLRRFEANFLKESIDPNHIGPIVLEAKSFAYLEDGVGPGRSTSTFVLSPEYDQNGDIYSGTWELRSLGAEDYDKGKIKRMPGDTFELLFTGEFSAKNTSSKKEK